MTGILEMEEDTEKSITPDNPHLIKVSKIKKNILIVDEDIDITEEKKPELTTFESDNPFKNCNEFYRFYRTYVKILNNKAEFYSMQSERRYALEILDNLILNNKNNDVNFLRSWIKYYVTVYLKGDNITKKDKTSLKTFKETLKVYINKFIDNL